MVRPVGTLPGAGFRQGGTTGNFETDPMTASGRWHDGYFKVFAQNINFFALSANEKERHKKIG
jgi:hypothetical protein